MVCIFFVLQYSAFFVLFGTTWDCFIFGVIVLMLFLKLYFIAYPNRMSGLSEVRQYHFYFAVGVFICKVFFDF